MDLNLKCVIRVPKPSKKPSYGDGSSPGRPGRPGRPGKPNNGTNSGRCSRYQM